MFKAAFRASLNYLRTKAAKLREFLKRFATGQPKDEAERELFYRLGSAASLLASSTVRGAAIMKAKQVLASLESANVITFPKPAF